MTEHSHGTALITGAAVRLGRAMAEHLARQGCSVAIHYGRSEQEALNLADDLQSRYQVNAVALQADLRTEPACEQLVQKAQEALGSLTYLINNASSFNKHCMTDADRTVAEQEFALNTWAPLSLIRAFAAANSGGGAILNMLDRRITTHDAACVPYLLSKQALAEITRLAALEYGPSIRVNGLGPGPLLPPPGESEDYLKKKGGRILLDHRPNPMDICETAWFLLTQPSLTGQILFVDSGQHLLGAEQV